MDQNKMCNLYKVQRTFHRCFLPSFISFGQAVSEEKLFQKSTNKKQELAIITAMFVNGSKWNEQFPQRTLHRCFLPRFGSVGKAVSEEKIFQKSTNQKQELSVAAMFVNESGQNYQSLQKTFLRCFLPSFVSCGQAVPEEKIFRNRPIRIKNCLWHLCFSEIKEKCDFILRTSHTLFVTTDKSCGLQVQRINFLRFQPIRSKTYTWQHFFLQDQDE